MFGSFRSRLSAFCRDTSGAATLEFVTIVPFLVIIVFMFVEIGILTGRTTLLKRGVYIAARDIRTDNDNRPIDLQEFRNTVCGGAFLLNNCASELTVDIYELDIASTADPTSTIVCRNRADPTLTPATTYDSGSDGKIMIIKTCLIVDPVFPGVGFAAGLNWFDGGYAIIAKSAFKVECKDEDNCG